MIVKKIKSQKYTIFLYEVPISEKTIVPLQLGIAPINFI